MVALSLFILRYAGRLSQEPFLLATHKSQCSSPLNQLSSWPNGYFYLKPTVLPIDEYAKRIANLSFLKQIADSWYLKAVSCISNLASFAHDLRCNWLKGNVEHLDYSVETHPLGDHVGGRGLLIANEYLGDKTDRWDWETYQYENQFQLE